MFLGETDAPLGNTHLPRRDASIQIKARVVSGATVVHGQFEEGDDRCRAAAAQWLSRPRLSATHYGDPVIYSDPHIFAEEREKIFEKV